MTDLSGKTIEELMAEKAEVVAKYDEAIEALKAEKIAELRKVATQLGLTSADLFGAGASKTKAKAPAKYAHPENPELTYSGRGRKPVWLVEYIENGGSEEDLLINKG